MGKRPLPVLLWLLLLVSLRARPAVSADDSQEQCSTQKCASNGGHSTLVESNGDCGGECDTGSQEDDVMKPLEEVKDTTEDKTASNGPYAKLGICDDDYFDAYAQLDIHEEMLKDQVRTKTYRNAMYHNKHLFRGRIILDVGCGTGILSMFAVKAGAKHVYAVDASSIIDHARVIVKDNGMSDQITLIKGKVEEIDLPVDTVDVIVSEWMGYCLFYESMLDTVIFARNKWLKPGGLIFPDKARLYLTAIEDYEYKNKKIFWWDSVYGFNMSSIGSVVLEEPLIDIVESEQIITDSYLVKEVDIYTVELDDLTFSVPYSLTAEEDDYIDALVAFFTVEFTKCHKKTVLTTSPEARYTHWKQTLFYVKDSITVKQGEQLTGLFTLERNPRNQRDLHFTITFDFNGELMDINSKQEYYLH